MFLSGLLLLVIGLITVFQLAVIILAGASDRISALHPGTYFSVSRLFFALFVRASKQLTTKHTKKHTHTHTWAMWVFVGPRSPTVAGAETAAKRRRRASKGLS